MSHATPVWPGQNYGGIPSPRCGDYRLHSGHHFPVRPGADDSCPGWRAEQAFIRNLILSVRDYLRDNWPVSGPPLYGALPPGLRLEMHPQVLRNFMYVTGIHSDTMAAKFGIPVKTSTDLPHDGWRLVIVTENVLLEGTAASDPG